MSLPRPAPAGVSVGFPTGTILKDCIRRFRQLCDLPLRWATWGSNPEPKDSRTVVVVGCGQHPLAACFASENAHRLRSDGVHWRSLVTEKCPNDHCRCKQDLTPAGGRRVVSLGNLVGERWSGPTGRLQVGPDVFPTDVPRLPPRSRARLESRRVRCAFRTGIPASDATDVRPVTRPSRDLFPPRCEPRRCGAPASDYTAQRGSDAVAAISLRRRRLSIRHICTRGRR